MSCWCACVRCNQQTRLRRIPSAPAWASPRSFLDFRWSHEFSVGMKRVSRGREEADAEFYRASSSLMERPCRECHHLARAGQCGSTRRHSLPRVSQLIINSNSISSALLQLQDHREPSNNGLANGQRCRLCRFVVPHHHPRQKQQGDRQQQDRREGSSRRRVALGWEAEAEEQEEEEEEEEKEEKGKGKGEEVEVVEAAEEKQEQKEALSSVTVSISRITGRRNKSWRRRRRRSTGSVAWTQRRVAKPSILN